jgi:hypothetical protein
MGENAAPAAPLGRPILELRDRLGGKISKTLVSRPEARALFELAETLK